MRVHRDMYNSFSNWIRLFRGFTRAKRTPNIGSKDAHNSTSHHLSIAIIGSGVAGLDFAQKCAEALPEASMVVFERKPYVGGRLQTKRDPESKRVLYEKGAWRVHASHSRTISLIRSLNLSLRPAQHDERESGVHSSTQRAQPAPSALSMSGMSSWGALALNEGLENEGLAKARIAEVRTGYDGILASASNSRTYQIKPTGVRSDGAARRGSAEFLIVEEGMQCIPKRMWKNIQDRFSSRVSIRLGSNVVNVRRLGSGKYAVCTSSNDKDSGTYKNKVCLFDVCVIATPPRFAQDWEISKLYLKPLIHSIGTLPLHHIYVKNRSSQPAPGTFDATANGIVVSGGDYDAAGTGPQDRGYFQFLYSCGRTARFWNNLAISYPDRFIREIRGLFRKWSATTQDPGPSTIDPGADIRRCYWPHAVHYWKPSFAFPQRGSDACVQKAVRPLPEKLPMLYCVGEAYSSVQGWTEGALQTTEVVLQCVLRDLGASVAERPRETKMARTKSGTETLRIAGRTVDVTRWKHSHPGSRQLIEKYIGKDITDVFNAVGHSDDAWRVIFHLSA